MVDLIATHRRTPYLCLDMQSLERPEFNSPQDRELLTTVLARMSDAGALIERSNVFWQERHQFPFAIGNACDTDQEIQDALQADVDYQHLVQFLEKSILRQKAIIELSLPKLSTSIPAKNKSGEWMIDRDIKNLVDWYGPKYAEPLGARKPALEIAHGTTVMAVDVVVELEDEAVLPRKIVRNDELPASDDELDIRFGRPDYKRMWVNESLFRETLCKGDQLCGQDHRCVRCRAEWTRKKYRDSPSAERIAAHILYASQQPEWQSVELDMISDFINILYDNLSFDKALLKELSRFGAVRIGQDKFVDEAVQEILQLYEIWTAESGG